MARGKRTSQIKCHLNLDKHQISVKAIMDSACYI